MFRLWGIGWAMILAAGGARGDAPPAITVYNQNFAVVRVAIPLDLKAGTNAVRYVGATAHLEPASVILRDPAGRRKLTILEQNYRNDGSASSL